ncbi:MAG: AdeC/AdeK/OprM family multidrug efflux complex outer membrane factor [Burkholderiaceae bacterium]|nr:AdeC/AdeK/OprM family multidrug efflux complex outer membrane factor [Burkholderiaceae bacterium]
MKRLTLIAFAAALSACASMAPQYERPAAPIGQDWPEGPAASAAAAAPAGADAAATAGADMPWREFVADDRLERLIDVALGHNRDLRIAALNIERARALYQIQDAGRFPTIDASGSGNHQRVPADLSMSGQAATTHTYGATIGIASYELDLFGRVRSLRDAALEQYFATGEARRSVAISLIAEVSRAWVALAADQARLELVRETLANREAAHKLVARSHELGVASALDLRQSQTTVESARADLARFERLLAQDRNMLALLVGAPVPAELLPGPDLDQVVAVTRLAAGLPSEVLQRRPDIAQAERLLRAANADIGAARAAFYPSIGLTAGIGTASSELSGLFDGGSGTWNFVPTIRLPIFDGGRNRALLEVAEVDRDIAIARYEQSIQAAFREVADALVQQGTINDEIAAQTALLEATTEANRLADLRFRQGVDSYLAVLDAQRSLYAAQQGLIELRAARSANLVTLYRALGGGWSAADETAGTSIPAGLESSAANRR